MIRRLVFFSLILNAGCTMTPISLQHKFSPDSKPSYEDYMDYYAMGFIGSPSVDMQKICMDQKPYAVQRAFTPDDALITLVTLGIYMPMTVRVWCGD